MIGICVLQQVCIYVEEREKKNERRNFNRSDIQSFATWEEKNIWLRVLVSVKWVFVLDSKKLLLCLMSFYAGPKEFSNLFEGMDRYKMI